MKAGVDWQGMMASQDPHFGQNDDMHCTLVILGAVQLIAVQCSAVQCSVV